ncbi:MAG: hypothetical protein E7171_00420 [Firmicutes bacterium]|nr:hypothetical protein [Bacillota bacterium]
MTKTQKQKVKGIKEEEIVMEMLDMLDSGHSWDEVFDKMCKSGQLNAFNKYYDMVRFIHETDALEKGVK